MSSGTTGGAGSSTERKKFYIQWLGTRQLHWLDTNLAIIENRVQNLLPYRVECSLFLLRILRGAIDLRQGHDASYAADPLSRGAVIRADD